jgi:hypothetical protein
MEVDCDLSSSIPDILAARSAKSMTKEMVIDMAFVLLGQRTVAAPI